MLAFDFCIRALRRRVDEVLRTSGKLERFLNITIIFDE